jgi:hypothetical protein
MAEADPNPAQIARRGVKGLADPLTDHYQLDMLTRQHNFTQERKTHES